MEDWSANQLATNDEVIARLHKIILQVCVTAKSMETLALRGRSRIVVIIEL